jgi:isopentenyl-diphosphate delta-isomerase type 1
VRDGASTTLSLDLPSELATIAGPRREADFTACSKPNMPEEIFDVVNEQDQVIGRQTRPEVHRLGLRHRAVHILLFNSRGEVFLQKRSVHKDTFPRAWDSSASGHLQPGEDYEAGAVREVQEELGIALLEPLQPLFKIDACAETGQEFVWVYRGQAEGPFNLHPEEIETGGWFTPERVSQWMQERSADFATALPLIWRLLNPKG